MKKFLIVFVTTLIAFSYAKAQDVNSSSLTNIVYYWDGKINGEEVKGNGSIVIDESTGSFSAFGNFDEMPNSFHPSLASWSFFSISCSNGAKKDEGAENILSLSKGDYQSLRTIAYYDEDDNFLGNLEINGRFTKVGPRYYKGEVSITGTYTGPVNIENPAGYILPAKPINERTLEGAFYSELSTTDGQIVKTENNHRYVFLGGVNMPLTSSSMDLKYMDGYWSPEKKAIKFKGVSVMRPCTKLELESIAINIDRR